jgi:hypothetical protein
MDNYLLIQKEDIDWVAYMECASIEKPSYNFKIFKTNSIENAIVRAQGVFTEYGYKFKIGDLHASTI